MVMQQSGRILTDASVPSSSQIRIAADALDRAVDMARSSGDLAIKNALGVAARHARARLNELIVQELETAPAVSGDE